MFLKVLITSCLFLSCFILQAQPAKDTVPFVCEYPTLMPYFPGGNDSLKSYLRRNMKWPGPSWDGEGTVYVKFKVDCKGSINDAVVIRGIDSLANREALRLVNNMPKWVNVDCKTQPNPVWYNLPIKFRLE